MDSKGANVGLENQKWGPYNEDTKAGRRSPTMMTRQQYEELKDAISEYIRKKDGDLVGQMVSQGTTPRKLTDLIGSLCDLTSGSGDKGTPIVWIQGYFDNYTA